MGAGGGTPRTGDRFFLENEDDMEVSASVAATRMLPRRFEGPDEDAVTWDIGPECPTRDGEVISCRERDIDVGSPFVGESYVTNEVELG